MNVACESIYLRGVPATVPIYVHYVAHTVGHHSQYYPHRNQQKNTLFIMIKLTKFVFAQNVFTRTQISDMDVYVGQKYPQSKKKYLTVIFKLFSFKVKKNKCRKSFFTK